MAGYRVPTRHITKMMTKRIVFSFQGFYIKGCLRTSFFPSISHIHFILDCQQLGEGLCRWQDWQYNRGNQEKSSSPCKVFDRAEYWLVEAWPRRQKRDRACWCGSAIRLTDRPGCSL